MPSSTHKNGQLGKKRGVSTGQMGGGEACGPGYPRREKGMVARAGEGAGGEGG